MNCRGSADITKARFAGILNALPVMPLSRCSGPTLLASQGSGKGAVIQLRDSRSTSTCSWPRFHFPFTRQYVVKHKVFRKKPEAKGRRSYLRLPCIQRWCRFSGQEFKLELGGRKMLIILRDITGPDKPRRPRADSVKSKRTNFEFSGRTMLLRLAGRITFVNPAAARNCLEYGS